VVPACRCLSGYWIAATTAPGIQKIETPIVNGDSWVLESLLMEHRFRPLLPAGFQRVPQQMMDVFTRMYELLSVHSRAMHNIEAIIPTAMRAVSTPYCSVSVEANSFSGGKRWLVVRLGQYLPLMVTYRLHAVCIMCYSVCE
jgi:hypothetical protein